MIRPILLGAGLGGLLGALQPVIQGTGGFNSVSVLTAEYTLVGGILGFTVLNYLRMRRRLMQRLQQQRSE